VEFGQVSGSLVRGWGHRIGVPPGGQQRSSY
jgi:hypothetical protein